MPMPLATISMAVLIAIAILDTLEMARFVKVCFVIGIINKLQTNVFHLQTLWN